ncbi:MAG: anhydro-N-acetylmuramic acid kinase [Bacteroidota bacterium]
MQYNVIGLMSGTSLDGLDIACCGFTPGEDRWSFTIGCAETIPYTGQWKKILASIESGTALEFVTADTGYGHLLGRLAREFIGKHGIQPDFIASHGHTIFHQPEKGITCQIGCGAAIAAETGLRVICDFRSQDVALGGQGAPLVPIGDKLLFGDFTFCLNLGGFANISCDHADRRIAYDISPANIVLNHLARQAGYEYDPEGMMAKGGSINQPLLDIFNALPYYHLDFPKSLGKEWVIQHIHPLLTASKLPVNDLLATFCEHIAMQVARATQGKRGSSMLVTGGGAFNRFLVERIRHLCSPEIILPDNLTINYKEALIFAFLGLRRWRNEANCLRSVTGAATDSSSGAIY